MPDRARLTAAEIAGGRAFERAGISQGRIDLVEIQGSFTIATLMTSFDPSGGEYL